MEEPDEQVGISDFFIGTPRQGFANSRVIAPGAKARNAPVSVRR